MATGFSYDVFLSFRGEDTRKGFTDHLYTALNQAGIRTFRDDDAMERGRLLKPELEKAIHESAITLIVFSEDYASSTWCLDEVLISIKEHNKNTSSSSKHEVVPVFYKVEPSDVRNQTGSFQKAFDGYDDEIEAETDLEKQRELMEKVRAWRDSLNKAATLTGMVLGDKYEADFIKNIVNVVRKKLDYKALCVEEKLFGIKENIEEIESWLQDPSPSAAILVIDGMGGIGKTTIAKCIFNINFRNYDASCFLADVNKEASNQTRELCRLQSQLLSTILKSGKEKVWNPHEGTNKITNVISMKKVLLVLDDVATRKQLDALLGPKRFYPGSKVIITTRHKELSTAFTGYIPKVHFVETLSTANAIEVFSLYAFDQGQPVDPYSIQSQVIVDYCNGLPLALQVLGSSLREKTIYEWQDTMRRLEATLDPEIQQVLEISYNNLKHETDKELFLHIACFFEGEEKDYIVKVLAECGLFPVVGIRNLTDGCLLYVDIYGRVMMHQLVKEMGQEVVRKESPKDPGERSRLWRHQDCIDVLQDRSGTKKVQGFMIEMQKTEELESTSAISITNPRKSSLKEYLGKRSVYGNDDADFEIGALEKMTDLMLLQLNHVTFYGECNKLPRKLRLLRWHGCKLTGIPIDQGCLKMLVVLDMSHSKLERLWDGFKVIESLKILNLSYCRYLMETPDFGGLPGLESLILKGCSSLIKVHESIASLEELVLLDLTNCRSLREFPCLPKSLVSLEMSGCGVVGRRVQSLDLVPSSSLLKRMKLSNCNLSDTSFPNDWSGLVSLNYLDISGNNVTFIPHCIQTLPILKTLFVMNCSKIQSIQGLPESLTFLAAEFNESLEKLKLRQTPWMLVHHSSGCPKLCEIEGRWKIRSIEKVDRKIIRYLGLQYSNTVQGVESGDLQALHGFGTFVLCLFQKIVRWLGLESNASEGMELGDLQVLNFSFLVSGLHKWCFKVNADENQTK